MALPKGLLIRANGYYFQARIPKQYQAHYPKPQIYEKLQADSRKEAVRLVHLRWNRLHEEFARIDSSGSRYQRLSEEIIQNLSKQLIHDFLSYDDDQRGDGKIDSGYLLGLDEVTDIFRSGYAEGRTKEISFWVENALQENGLDATPGSEAYKKLSYEFLKAGLKALEGIHQRQRGRLVETPEPPDKIIPKPITAKEDFDSLDSLKDYWLSQPSKATGGKKGRTAANEANTVIKKFRKYFGELSVSQITEDHIVSLKDKMLAEGVSAATINKSRGVLAAMFSTAKKNRKIAVNPCEHMEKLPIQETEVEKLYTIQELQVIFNSPVFTKGYRPARFEGQATFWLPLLALYTGARLNELGQIYVDDIGAEDDIHYILIKTEAATGRTNKTGNSRRIPVHPELIRIGFIDYCASIKEQGHQQLFPELKVTRNGGKVADKWGSWWSNYVKKELGISRIPKPFHGFRHSFIDHGRRCKMDTDLRNIIEGHAPNTVDMKVYGGAYYPLEPLYDEMQKLSFKGLDLTNLYVTTNNQISELEK